MGGLIGGEYEEVIHVDDEPSFSNHVSKGVIHKALECGGGVVETKEHNGGFKQSFVDNEGCLPLMSILDVDIVVSPSDVELGEVFCIFEFIDEVGDEGKEVGISDGMFIQVVIILTGAEFPILLLDKEEGGGLERVGRVDLFQG